MVYFKMNTTKNLHNPPGRQVELKNYYVHIIRDKKEYYIKY